MKNIIFDFNGTLFLDSPIHLKSWGLFFERRGLPYSDELFYTKMCGPTNSTILRTMIDPSLTDAEADILSEEKEQIYRDIVKADPAMQALTPGAAEMLDNLKALGAKYAIATGSTKSNVDFYMETLGIDRWFDYDHIFYDEIGLPGKPDPAIYLGAMKKLGFTPADTIVVEDAMPGVQSAVGAGIETIIAMDTTLGPHAFDAFSQVKAVIHDFYGFERFLED